MASGFASPFGDQIREGDVVFVPQGIGVVKWIGVLQFTGTPSIYVGIELADPRGDHDGFINGEEYFRCKQGHGVHVPLVQVARKVRAHELLAKISLLNTFIQTLVGKLRGKDDEVKLLKSMQTNVHSFVHRTNEQPNPTPQRREYNSNKELEDMLSAAQQWESASGEITPLTPHSDKSETRSLTVIHHSSGDEMEMSFEPLYLDHSRPSLSPDQRRPPKISRQDESPPHTAFVQMASQHPRGAGRGVLQSYGNAYLSQPMQRSTHHHQQFSDGSYVTEMSLSSLHASHSHRTTMDTMELLPTPQSDMMMMTPPAHYDYISPSQLVTPIRSTQVPEESQSYPQHCGGVQQHPQQRPYPPNMPRYNDGLAADITHLFSSSPASPPHQHGQPQQHPEHARNVSRSGRKTNKKQSERASPPSRDGRTVHQVHVRQFVTHHSPPVQQLTHSHRQAHQRNPSVAQSYPIPQTRHRAQTSSSSHESAHTVPVASREQTNNIYDAHAAIQQEIDRQSEAQRAHSSNPGGVAVRPSKRIHLTSPLRVKVTATAKNNTPSREHVQVVPQQPAQRSHLAPRGSVQEAAESPRRKNDGPQTFYHPSMAMRSHGLNNPPYRLNMYHPNPHVREHGPSPGTGTQSTSQPTSQPTSRRTSPDLAMDVRVARAIAQTQREQQVLAQSHLVAVHGRSAPSSAPNSSFVQDVRETSEPPFQQQRHQVRERPPHVLVSSGRKLVPNRPLPQTPANVIGNVSDPLGHPMHYVQVQYATEPVSTNHHGAMPDFQQYQTQHRFVQDRNHVVGVAQTDPGRRIPIRHSKKLSNVEVRALSMSQSSPMLDRQGFSPGPVGHPMHPVTQHSTEDAFLDDRRSSSEKSHVGFHGSHGSRPSRARQASFLGCSNVYGDAGDIPSSDDDPSTPDYTVRYESLSRMDPQHVKSRPETLVSHSVGLQPRQRGNRVSVHEPRMVYDDVMQRLPNIAMAQHVHNNSSASAVPWYHSPQAGSFSYGDFPQIVHPDGTALQVPHGHGVRLSQNRFSDFDSIDAFTVPTGFVSGNTRASPQQRPNPQYQRELPSLEETGAAQFLNSFKSPAIHDRDMSESIFTETTVQTESGDPYVMFQGIGSPSGGIGSDSESPQR